MALSQKSKPVINGLPVVGQTLTFTPGEYEGTNAQINSFYWKVSTDGGTKYDQVGETGQLELVVQAEDVGSMFVVNESVTHSGGAKGFASDPVEITETSDQPVSQISAPSITGEAKVGVTLSANAGEYTSGERLGWVWYKSQNGGAEWVVAGEGDSYVLAEENIGQVFMVAELIQTAEDDTEGQEFRSDRTSGVRPADTVIGEVVIDGPDKGSLQVPYTFTAINAGESQYLTYAWSVEGGSAVITDSTANPTPILFTSISESCVVKCVIDTPDNTCTDAPANGSKSFEREDEGGTEPPAEPDGVQLNSNAAYQAESIQRAFTRQFNRELVITPVTDQSFMILGGGKIGVGPVGYEPTQGEMKYLVDWFSFRWTGDIEVSQGQFVLTVVGSGNFHPAGGVTPRSIQVVN